MSNPLPNIPAAPIKTIDGVDIFRSGNLIYWQSGLAVDADGSPRAYHPISANGLDNLKNAGRPGDWWALVCDSRGLPVVQGAGDPAPGYYVSTTSLADATRRENDPLRYVNSETVPYLAIPKSFLGFMGKGGICRVGDFALAVNTANGHKVPCIVADVGSDESIGEGSIALASALGVPSSPRSGGCDTGILFILFPNTRTTPAWPRTVADINAAVAGLVTAHHLNLPNLNA